MKQIIFLLLLLANTAIAATTADCVTLFSSAAVTSNQNGTVRNVGLTANRFKFISTASNTSGTTPTLDIKIQHCRRNSDGTCSSSCTDTPVIFTQCTTGTCYTSGVQHVDVNMDSVHFLPCIRPVLTVGGTSPSYSATVELCTAK